MNIIKSFCFNPFSENTYIIQSEGDAIIIDPGNYSNEENQEIIAYIAENNLNVKKIINTHCHVDHVLGIAFLKNYYQVPLAIGLNELEVLRSVKLYAPSYGFVNFIEPEADEFLKEGQQVVLGATNWEVIDVPGHAPGHIALYEAKLGICIAGDVLFNRSIGRTDLPGGDFDTLIESIRSKLFVLPDKVRVLSGHGPETSIGEEIRHNPFLQ